jgi:hypothetical protein
MPYFSNDGTSEAHLDLRIIGATEFQLLTGFTYEDPDSGNETTEVPDGMLTDLASVPFFLQWLVRSYGKHTRGALIHDARWDTAHTSTTILAANLVFRHAMREDGVPLVRRWFIWAAVSMAGLARLGVFGYFRLGVWAAAMTALLASILAGAGTHVSLLFVVSLTAALIVVAAAAALIGIGGPPGSARRQVGLQVAGISIGYAVIAVVVVLVSDIAIVRNHALASAALAFVVAVFAASPNWRASAIATPTVAVVLIPTTAVFLALAAYGFAELIGYSIRYPVRVARKEAKPAPLVSETLGRPPAPV